MFFDGLVETEEPFSFMVQAALKDMLNAISEEQLLALLPKLIMPAKRVLDTKDPATVARMLKVLQRLVIENAGAGRMLVQYYKFLLPVCNYFLEKGRHVKCGGLEMGYRKGEGQEMGALVEETLALFERAGGDGAYINIKYIIPTYESHVHDDC
jgi:hypothetical protein